MHSFKELIDLEEQTQEIQDVCLQFIKDIITENYDFTNEENEFSEEAEIALDIILDYFIENYDSTLLESNDINKNDELFLEIHDILLDESIGSAIAGLVHGTGGERRAYVKAKLKPELMRIKQKENPEYYTQKTLPKTDTLPAATQYIPTYKEKAKEHQEKLKNNAYGTGFSGMIKKKMGEREVTKSQRKFEKAESKIRMAKAKIGVAGERLRYKENQHGRLAYKIDRAIRPTNIARAAIKGTLKGVAWTARKILGKPTRYNYRYGSYRNNYGPYRHQYRSQRYNPRFRP